MNELFLATLISMGPTADNTIRLAEVVQPVELGSGQVLNIKRYVPAISALDSKPVSVPHITRHISAK